MPSMQDLVAAAEMLMAARMEAGQPPVPKTLNELAEDMKAAQRLTAILEQFRNNDMDRVGHRLEGRLARPLGEAACKGMHADVVSKESFSRVWEVRLGVHTELRAEVDSLPPEHPFRGIMRREDCWQRPPRSYGEQSAPCFILGHPSFIYFLAADVVRLTQRERWGQLAEEANAKAERDREKLEQELRELNWRNSPAGQIARLHEEIAALKAAKSDTATTESLAARVRELEAQLRQPAEPTPAASRRRTGS